MWFYGQQIVFFYCLVTCVCAGNVENNYSHYYRPKPDDAENFYVAWKCNNDSQRCERTIIDTETNSSDLLTSLGICKLLCNEHASLWPKPFHVSFEKKLLPLNVGDIAFDVVKKDGPDELWTLLQELQHYFVETIGYKFKNKNVIDGGRQLRIILQISNPKVLFFTNRADESYNLTITANNDEIIVLISGETYLGVRHATETLIQLIVYDEFSSLVWIPSAVIIHDTPAYTHRGVLLDTSRSFYSVASIKRVLDGMACNKLNSFHWHITDSHSFPFESSNYPKLSAYGSYSPSQVYTKTDIKDIVRYAQIRGIRVIPELDSPAHVGEGWQAFNNQNSKVILCFKGEPWRHFCVEPPCGVLNPINPKVYEILRNLYAEFNELFDSDVFHMGGDEVQFSCWNETAEVTDWLKSRNLSLSEENYTKLWAAFQSQAVFEYDKSAKKRTKTKIILWTSTLTKEKEVTKYLPPDSYIIQVWTTGYDRQIADLLIRGYELIISNYDALYFDCGFGAWIGEGNNWCSPYIGWQKVYTNSPQKIVDNLKQTYNLTEENLHSLILGAEAALWSEQSDENTLDTRLWPRAAALAERLWSNPETDWKAAESRILTQRERMSSRNIAADLIEPLWCHQNEGLCY